MTGMHGPCRGSDGRPALLIKEVYFMALLTNGSNNSVLLRSDEGYDDDDTHAYVTGGMD